MAPCNRYKVERAARGCYIWPVMRSGVLFLILLAFAFGGLGCRSLARDNAVDPAVDNGLDAETGAGLSLVVPLPKALATVVDSLVARLTGPDMVPVVKPLDYPSPLGPATLTIGAVSPGSGLTLTIEGYDLTGRLILSGERGDITIVTGDTTRIAIDLRLAIDASELDEPDTTAAAGADTTVVETPDETPPEEEGAEDGSAETPADEGATSG